MAKSLLVDGDDGLVAREVGSWAERKAHYVDRYAHIFATGMKNKWPRRTYVELFAGPGRSRIRRTGEYIDGSAIRSLSAEFTDRVFVDIDPLAAAALDERCRRLSAGKPAVVIQGDCNEVIGDVVSAIPPDGLTLAFIDPTNWQVHLDTVKALARGTRADLLVTFMYGQMRRVTEGEPAALTAFFGTDEWRRCLGGARWEVLDRLAALYNRQLEPLGYRPSYSRREVVKNSTNAAMYALLLFSRHQRGVEFWAKATSGVDESGQLPLFRE